MQLTHCVLHLEEFQTASLWAGGGHADGQCDGDGVRLWICAVIALKLLQGEVGPGHLEPSCRGERSAGGFKLAKPQYTLIR